MGHLGSEVDFSVTDGRFVTLVDGRPGSRHGQILQHPLFNDLLDQMRADDPNKEAKLPDDISRYKVPLEQLPRSDEEIKSVVLYSDPLGKHPDGGAYSGNYIVAQEPVRLKGIDQALICLVQLDYDRAALPVRTLGGGLVRDAIVALLLILAGILYIWYLVTRALRDPNEAMRRSGGLTVQPSSLHSMETLELPEKLRELPRQSD